MSEEGSRLRQQPASGREDGPSASALILAQRGRGVKVHDSRGRVVGEVVGTVLYMDCALGSRDMMWSPSGWGLEVVTLQEAQQAGAGSVQIPNPETGHVYGASIATIRRKGIQHGFRHGLRLHLPLRYWSVDGQGPELPSYEWMKRVDISD